MYFDQIRKSDNEWRQVHTQSLRDPEAPAFVYLMEHAHYRALKIGVTGEIEPFGLPRVLQHASEGWTEVKSWDFEIGWEALEAEFEVLDRWRNVLNFGAAVAPSQMPQGGASETIKYSETSKREALEFMDRAHRRRTIFEDSGENSLWVGSDIDEEESRWDFKGDEAQADPWEQAIEELDSPE